MVISDYHVQNVHRVYSRQLLRAKLPYLSNRPDNQPIVKVTISEEAKRRLQIDRTQLEAMEQVHPNEVGQQHEG